MRWIACLLALAAAAPATLAQRLEAMPPDAPVARIGDRVVTARELLSETVQRFAPTVLADLVADAQLELACAAAGVRVTDEEIGQALAALRAELGDEGYALLVARAGGEREQRRSLRRDMLLERWLADAIAPTDEEVRALYAASPLQLAECRASGLLVATEEEAKEMRAGVLTAGNFAALARDVSLDESAARGGDLGVVNQLNSAVGPEALAELLRAAPGAIVGPFEGEVGWWMLLRGDDMPTRLATFEEMKGSLAEQVRAGKLAAQRSRWRRLVRAGRPGVVLSLAPLMALAGGPPAPAWPRPSPTDGTVER